MTSCRCATPAPTSSAAAAAARPTTFARSPTPSSIRPARDGPRVSERPIRIGIQLPEVEREVRWPEQLDMIRAIEDLGFDSIWLGEHLLYRWEDRAPRGPWE